MVQSFSSFVDKIQLFFSKRKEENNAENWLNFAIHRMPKSEQVENFVLDHEKDSPLGQYLFQNVNFGASSSTQSGDSIEVSAMTGFSHAYHRNRATLFDLSLMDHIEQCKQTIPWSGHRDVHRDLVFTPIFVR